MEQVRTPIRVVIADDVPDMLDLIAQQLISHCTILARVADGVALVESACKLTPDLLVTDISMPRLSGIEALRRLHRLGVQIPSVVVTASEDEDLMREALSLGARGFVVKSRLASDLLDAVREAYAGRIFISKLRSGVTRA